MQMQSYIQPRYQCICIAHSTAQWCRGGAVFALCCVKDMSSEMSLTSQILTTLSFMRIEHYSSYTVTSNRRYLKKPGGRGIFRDCSLSRPRPNLKIGLMLSQLLNSCIGIYLLVVYAIAVVTHTHNLSVHSVRLR